MVVILYLGRRAASKPQKCRVCPLSFIFKITLFWIVSFFPVLLVMPLWMWLPPPRNALWRSENSLWTQTAKALVGVSVNPNIGEGRWGYSQKRGRAFPRRGCLMDQQDLTGWGTSAVLPEQPALPSSHHVLVVRGKMGVFPLCDRQHELQLQVWEGKTVRCLYNWLQIYEMQCFKEIHVCASVWTWRWPVSFCHFYNGHTCFGAITTPGWYFCRLSLLEKKYFWENRIEVGFISKTLLKAGYLCQCFVST